MNIKQKPFLKHTGLTEMSSRKVSTGNDPIVIQIAPK